MSVLIGAVASPAPFVDYRLQGKFVMSSDTIIPDEILGAMTLVLQSIAEELDLEEKKMNDYPINCIFSETDSFAIRIGQNQTTAAMRVVFYPLHKLLPLAEQGEKLKVALAKDLCQMIWDVYDEVAICFKVLQVLRQLKPNLELEDLFPRETVKECRLYMKELMADPSWN